MHTFASVGVGGSCFPGVVETGDRPLGIGNGGAKHGQRVTKGALGSEGSRVESRLQAKEPPRCRRTKASNAKEPA